MKEGRREDWDLLTSFMERFERLSRPSEVLFLRLFTIRVTSVEVKVGIFEG